ncbi:MAG: TIR domain-containing protein [Bacteroidetes bacterium]|nr:TIR domain-containing protein [Bacteroidota bacterium]
MADIFISYSRKDAEAALALAERLRSDGASVWMDTAALAAAETWSAEIVTAIEGCTFFIVLISPNAVASRNVTKEVSLASESKKTIIPIELVRCELNPAMKYALAGLQKVKLHDEVTLHRSLSKLGLAPGVHTAPSAPQAVASPSRADSGPTRLAVFPFEDQSPTRDHEWFSDGLTDELISMLNKVDALLVLDRNSTRAYRDAKMTTKQIARELQVRYVIVGAVRKAGEKIRVQASLIDPETGKVLWDEKFNGTMDDIFEIQEKTARDIVEGLKITLTPAERSSLDQKMTDSPEAYELLMRASRKLDEEMDHAGGTRLAERALEIDPNCAAALYLISVATSNQYRIGNRSDASLLERERGLVKQLMTLAPETHYCYIARANYYLNIDETELAVEMAERAVSVSPKRPRSHGVLGFIYSRLNRPADAVREFRRAIELDPNSGTDHVSLLTVLFVSGAPLEQLRAQYPNVKRHLDARIAEYPDSLRIRTELLNAAIQAQIPDDAVAVAEAILARGDVDADTEYCCAEAFVLAGDLERGRTHLRSAIDRGQDTFTIWDESGFLPLNGTPEYDFLVAHIARD